MTAHCCLVLRLAGPLQAWGSKSQFNRRETDNQPTKSGVIGLLAAADGRIRSDPIVDLIGLQLGVRVDQEGSLLRDYHTVSDLRGRPLLAAKVNKKGRQAPTSPAKYTGVTQRFYLQDAVFVAAVSGDRALLEGLAVAVQRPGFPLALGRRSCIPSQPILVAPDTDDLLWTDSIDAVLRAVPWQASMAHRRRLERQGRLTRTIRLAATIEDEAGEDMRSDVPASFVHADRAFTTRTVRNEWVEVPTEYEGEGIGQFAHDPFELLGW